MISFFKDLDGQKIQVWSDIFSSLPQLFFFFTFFFWKNFNVWQTLKILSTGWGHKKKYQFSKKSIATISFSKVLNLSQKLKSKLIFFFPVKLNYIFTKDTNAEVFVLFDPCFNRFLSFLRSEQILNTRTPPTGNWKTSRRRE